jgi:hypothetical protein
MTRRELEDDVEQLASERIETMTANPSRYVYSKIRVLFEDKNGDLLQEAGEFDSMEVPECVLQDAVFGNSLKEMLLEKGASCLSSEIRKGFGLPDGCKVAGVMFSTEAILATRTLMGKDKKVKGYPFLLVSGQTRSGHHKTILKPLVLDDSFKAYGGDIDMPPKVKEIIKTVEKAPAFLGGFFTEMANGSDKGVVLFNQVA